MRASGKKKHRKKGNGNHREDFPENQDLF